MKKLWMRPSDAAEAPGIVVFRSVFTLPERRRIAFRYSADESAMLFLDGAKISTGPERGTAEYWFYQTVEFTAEAGSHVLTARVLMFGKERMAGQMTVHHGFHVEEATGTLANWEYQIIGGCRYFTPFPDWGSNPRIEVDETSNLDILKGEGGVWHPVQFFEDDRVLHASELPPMRCEKVEPELFAANLEPEIIRDGRLEHPELPAVPVDLMRLAPSRPAQGARRADILRFARYTCVWDCWHFEGKGTVRIIFTETPYETEEYDNISLKGHKANRSGEYFAGNGDIFHVNGTLDWTDFQWRAGRYVIVETDGLVQYRGEFFETGYPIPDCQGQSPVIRAAYNTLRACCHDTFMDCPFYERLQYIGDTRLTALVLAQVTHDDRLIGKMLRQFLDGQQPDGSLLTQYPSKYRQVIPSYMPIYLLMFHDYWAAHRNAPLMEELLPKVDKLGKYLLACVTPDGMKIPGWQFIDWCRDWQTNGVPPGGVILDLLNLLAFRAVAEMVPDAAYSQGAETLSQSILRQYYVPEAHLIYDDLAHTRCSEHAASLGILAGLGENLRLQAPGMTECSIYFSYYYFLACRKAGRKDLLQARAKAWQECLREGLTTYPEEFQNPRSDCHGWSTYILLFDEVLEIERVQELC